MIAISTLNSVEATEVIRRMRGNQVQKPLQKPDPIGRKPKPAGIRNGKD